MTARTHWVYRAYDADGACLYVGCTKNLDQRSIAHRYQSLWYEQMARCVVAGPYSREVALRIETEQIAKIQPLFNKRGVPVPVDPHPLAPNLSTSQTVQFLGLNDQRMLQRFVHEGVVKAYNVGTEMQPRWIFLVSELEALTGREVA